MNPAHAQAFTYQVNWRSRSHHAGDHGGLQHGLGMEFHGNAPLVDYPDARRIDIRQTLRDPGEQVYVRLFHQKNATPVYAVCDMSGSMRFGGKMALAAEIAASVAFSAHQAGDMFGFVGFDETPREEWLVPPSHRLHEALDLAERLKDYRPAAAGSAGLLEIGLYLAQKRSLVFLISDFHMPLEFIEQALNLLSRHHVVPIVLWTAGEYRKLPDFGLNAIVDPETGRRRMLFFRKALKARFEQAFAARRAALEELFMRYETPACFVEDRFDAEAVSEYFQQFSAL
ncbi:MAG TPA: DUF58 domain-containing protein [Novimethylophilus sp.]|jgi:uncharacterized protein (DUF58 family)|uniref:DUF58 domain-containing protein n=1 Tax=Novimethylophilus sp. TaxID=2137426 RepID=UPI002F3EC3E9